MATKARKTKTARQVKWQGMNWLSRLRRLSIYLRDGLACVYCGLTLEQGAELSLDHLKPHSKGGGNESTNLVTCCKTCNSARGSRPVATFCGAVAHYLGLPKEAILAHVRRCAKRSLPMAQAKEMMARRGSVRAALENR